MDTVHGRFVDILNRFVQELIEGFHNSAVLVTELFISLSSGAVDCAGVDDNARVLDARTAIQKGVSLLRSDDTELTTALSGLVGQHQDRGCRSQQEGSNAKVDNHQRETNDEDASAGGEWKPVALLTTIDSRTERGAKQMQENDSPNAVAGGVGEARLVVIHD